MKSKSIRASAMAALFGSLLTTAALAGTPHQSKSKTPAAGNIANGKKAYAANTCGTCHSINGEGGSTGPDLSTIGADKAHNAAWFKKAIVTPKALHPDSSMPPYDKMKAKDLTDLTAYLMSLKKKAAEKTIEKL